MNKEQKAMLESYGRSVLSAMLFAFLTMGGDIFALDTDSLKIILAAGVSAIAPVAIRYFNTKDPAFGKVAEAIFDSVDDKLKPKKKASVKKKAK